MGMPDPKNGTRIVRVRIPVAIDDQGRWFAYGFKGAEKHELESVIEDMREAYESEGVYWRYLTADIEIPMAKEVEAEVESD